ncbi:MAG: hypothetical protein WBG02_01010 [Candidatus Acidiferrum sp.]
MTIMGVAEVTGAVVAGGLEHASLEAINNTKTKDKTRNEGSICCTVTGNYITTDEINKTKVAQIRRGENGTEEQRKIGEMP